MKGVFKVKCPYCGAKAQLVDGTAKGDYIWRGVSA